MPIHQPLTKRICTYWLCFIAHSELAAQMLLAERLLTSEDNRPEGCDPPSDAEIAAVRARQLPLAEIALRDVASGNYDEAHSLQELKHRSRRVNLVGAEVERFIPAFVAMHEFLKVKPV